jgi:uncharacterized membrane-anchored protein
MQSLFRSLGGSDLGINLGILIIAGIISVIIAGSRRLLKGPIKSIGRAFAITRIGVNLVDFLYRNSSGEGLYILQISRYNYLLNYLF